MSALVESMAYNRIEVPWHGMGKPVDADLTPEEMAIAAEINWGVELRPLYHHGHTVDTQGEVPLHLVKRQMALVRTDTGALLSIVGNKYKPVQNVEAMEFFSKFVRMGGMTMETMGSLQDGQYIWGLAKIGKGFKIGKRDENEGYLLLSQPHVFGLSMILQTTAIRVVCWNTYSASISAGNYRATAEAQEDDEDAPSSRWSMRHSRRFDDVSKEEAETTLGIACAQFEQFGEMAQFMARKAAKDDEVKAFFYKLIGISPKAKANAEGSTDKPAVERLMDIYHNAPGQEDMAEGTWWGAFNSVTYLTDHVIGKTQDSRLTRAWFGDRALMKRRALGQAMELAKAA